MVNSNASYVIRGANVLEGGLGVGVCGQITASAQRGGLYMVTNDDSYLATRLVTLTLIGRGRVTSNVS